MWKGAPASSRCRPARAHRRTSPRRGTRRRMSRACARSRAPAGRSRARAISHTSSIDPRSRTRPITSTPNGTSAILLLEPRAQLAELLDDRVDRVLARPAEQEAGVEHDDLGAGSLRDAGRVVEHPERHVQLLAALGVAHEAGDRRMQRQRDAVCRASSPSSVAKPRSRSRTCPTEEPRRPSSRAPAAHRRPRCGASTATVDAGPNEVCGASRRVR